MKFLENYRQDILKSFEVHGLTKNDFCFIKRKGRIITEHHNSKQTFSFFIKKDTTIDEITHQWIQTSQFEIRINGGRPEWVDDWDKVLKHFARWLIYLKQT